MMEIGIRVTAYEEKVNTTNEILVHNHLSINGMVIVEMNGEAITVRGDELILAVDIALSRTRLPTGEERDISCSPKSN